MMVHRLGHLQAFPSYAAVDLVISEPWARSVQPGLSCADFIEHLRQGEYVHSTVVSCAAMC